MNSQHLSEHNLMWNQHRNLAWFFAGRSLIVAWRAFWHGLIPSAYCGGKTALSAHRAILPAYEAKEQAMR